MEDEIRVTVIATGFKSANPAVPNKPAAGTRPAYGGFTPSIQNPENVAPAVERQAPSRPFPQSSNTEIPPWLRG